MNSRHHLLSLAFLAIGPASYATHLSGGELRYEHISGLTYRIQGILYTYLSSPADRPEIIIDQDTVPRTTMVDFPDGSGCGGIRVSTYETTRVFAGPGEYVIHMIDMNRNGGIVNIPNSDSQGFSVSATLIINPLTASNASPIFNAHQFTSSWNWSTLIHELQATDADGDSLSFHLVAPQDASGSPIVGYEFPEQFTSPGGFTWLDPETGTFLWDHPTLIGPYVIAIRCDEWRDGVLIGQVTRDMTICVSELPTAIEGGSNAAEDVRMLRVNDEWALDNNTQDLLTAQLIDARGAIIRTFNLASGRTIVPLIDQANGFVLLRTMDAEGRQRIFKLTP